VVKHLPLTNFQETRIMPNPFAHVELVMVDDVKRTVAKARKLGATVQIDYMDIGEMGAIGVFVDRGSSARAD
jgi:hypothetical protein